MEIDDKKTAYKKTEITTDERKMEMETKEK